jgi:hypothetical protein
MHYRKLGKFDLQPREEEISHLVLITNYRREV